MTQEQFSKYNYLSEKEMIILLLAKSEEHERITSEIKEDIKILKNDTSSMKVLLSNYPEIQKKVEANNKFITEKQGQWKLVTVVSTIVAIVSAFFAWFKPHH